MRCSSHLSRWPVRGLVALSLGLGLGACGGGGGGTEAIGPYWVPTQVTVVDLDGDGLADVITLATWTESYTAKTGHLKVYRQTAPGVFALPIDHVLPGYPWRFALADLNGDGRLDAVVTHPDAKQVSVLLQDVAAPGHLLAEQRIPVDVTAYEVALGDFNDDALADILLSNNLKTATGLVLLPQQPGRPGQFQSPVAVPLGRAATHLAAADLDGDGRFDVLASDSDTVVAMLQRPGGTWAAPAVLGAASGGRVVRWVMAADANGDGRPDVLYTTDANEDADLQASTLSVALQSTAAAGTFAPALDAGSVASGFWGYAVGDLNQDGRPDVVQGRYYPVRDGVASEVVLRLQTGSSGTVFGSQVVAMPSSIEPVAVGDVNADGALDIVAFGARDLLYVMRQRAGAPGSFDAVAALR